MSGSVFEATPSATTRASACRWPLHAQYSRGFHQLAGGCEPAAHPVARDDNKRSSFC